MSKIEYKDLLDAGVHFGHLTRKWDPRMAPYIFMEKNGIHIIDLNKTLACLDEASNAIKQIVRSGKKVMFVATKKQAKDLVAAEAQRLNMPYVTERWLGGMLTNFATIRKSLKKMSGKNKKLNIDLSQMFNFCVFKSIVDYSCVSASTALFASSSSESLASSLSLLRSERPSSIAAPNAFTKRDTDLNASSFAGIGKSTSFGLELVSTKANTGMPNF